MASEACALTSSCLLRIPCFGECRDVFSAVGLCLAHVGVRLRHAPLVREEECIKDVLSHLLLTIINNKQDSHTHTHKLTSSTNHSHLYTHTQTTNNQQPPPPTK